MVGRSSQVARGLNTIAANITQNQDALAAYGITVEDANGNLKSTYDVLSELKPKWDEMKEAERVALGMTLAGKNQYKVLASVMKNFEHAIGATNSAINSSGTALKQNAAYMESIEARITGVKAAFQQMSTAVIDSDLVKGILDIVKAMAEFGGTDFGAAVTQFVLLSGLSWGGLQLLGQSILPGIISSFENLAKLRAGETLANLTAKGTTFAGVLSVSLPYILAITAAIVGLVTIVKAVKEAYDAANPSIEQASLNMKNAQEALKQTKTSYNNAKNKLDELNATPYEDRTSEIQAEIDELQTLVDYYETLLKIRGQESQAATAQYISAVEKSGLGIGQFQGTTQYSTYDNEGNLIYVDKLTEKYHSLTAAIQAAAKAQYDIDKTVIDITDITTAQEQLERLGWSFDEVTISVDKVQQSLTYYGNTMENNGKMTIAYMDDYQDLIALSEDYVVALENQQKQGVELTKEQLKFIEVYRQSQKAYEEYISTQAEAQNVTTEEILSRYEAASALAAYAQELINAANAYQIFKDRLSETGDYDDTFKGFSSILKDVVSEFDAGQIGSQAFLTGLELLTGQTMTSAEAIEYMNTHLDTLKLLFGDSESGGIGLLTALEDLGMATLDADGNLQISIDDFTGLAEQLGISEGALYSLTEALRIMGINFQYNADDILSEISKLGDGIVDFGDTTSVNFEKYVDAAKAAEMSNDEIIAIGEILSNVEGIELSGVAEGLALLAGNSEEASADTDDLNSGLKDVGNNVDSIESVSGAMGDLASNTSSAAESAASLAASLASISNFKAPSLGNLISGLFGHAAEGTSYAKEGPSLVNEEGPELIQSGDEAYIAGGGYPTVVQLHTGDKVYTAEETKNILNGNKLSSSIQAHGGGTKSKTGIGGATTIVTGNILKGLEIGKATVGNNGGSTSASTSATEADIKAEFDTWYKAKKHALEMDEISEKEYYESLEEMNEKYFKNSEEHQDEYWKYQEQIYKWRKKQEENAASEREKADEEAAKAAQKLAEEEAKAYKGSFNDWLSSKKHQLAMDEITEEAYYAALKVMNDKYFKGKEEYQSEYQKYQEQIYSWEKRQAEQAAKDAEQAAKEKANAEQKASEDAIKAYKEEFDTWLEGKKHQLAMDEISEGDYYEALRVMNDKYFKDREEYQKEYQKYQEQIYSWEKKQQEKLIKQAEELAAAQEKAYKDEFDSWLSFQQHALNMDFITQEEYYSSLGEMNDKYFKDKEEYQKEYWKYEEQIYSWEKKQQEELVKAEEQAIKDAEEAAQEALKAHKEEFNNWLKEEEHALAMDLITQEEYYEALEKMSEQYFKDREEYQEEYWKYEEKIYSWKKKQAEEEIKAQEEALKDRIELEKKLNNLATAKASKVKVYQDGQFRYVSDREALAKAQAALSSYGDGTLFASGGLSLVGENGPEMRVVNQGDGILPANITKNLWAWGSINPNAFNKVASQTYNFDIDNLSLPDIRDADSFVKGLKSFALQYATQRGS